MNFLLLALGSAGDVHPVVGVGRALADRGHRVVVAANPYFAPLAQRVGLEFEPISTADEYLSVMHDKRLWRPLGGFAVMAEKLILGQMAPVFELVERFHRRERAVVAAPITAIGARIAQEALGVPLATMLLQPVMVRSVIDPPLLPPGLLPRGAPRFLHRLFFRGADFFADRFLAPRANAFRASRGLAPARGFMGEGGLSPRKAIGLFPDWFAPPQADWPEQVTLTGFPLWDEGTLAPVDDELEKFLSRGESPLVFTFGSAMQQGQAFFRAAIDAAAILGRSAVLLTRYRHQLPERLAGHVRHFDFIPLSRLLPRSAAIVHHGGVGTLAQGLAAGIPQLTMPLAHDQPDNAQRLRRLGVGATISPRRFTPRRVARALEKLLAAEQVAARCRELAARIDKAQAVARTCDELEQLGRE